MCAVAGCSRSKPPAGGVTVATGENIAQTFHGTVHASKQTELGFRVAGTMAHLPVKEGEKVNRGAVVAQLRQSDFQARLDAVQAHHDQALANLGSLQREQKPDEQLWREGQERIAAIKLANARAEFDRYASLIPSGAASRSEYEAALTAYLVAQEEHKTVLEILENGEKSRKAEIEAAQASVQALETKVAAAKRDLEDSWLRSPYDAVVVRRLADEGQPVKAGMPVVTLQSTDGIEIIVEVSRSVLDATVCSSKAFEMSAEINGKSERRYPIGIKTIARVRGSDKWEVRFELQTPLAFTPVLGTTAIVFIRPTSENKPHPTASHQLPVCRIRDIRSTL